MLPHQHIAHQQRERRLHSDRKQRLERSSVPGVESISHTKVVRKTTTPQEINDPHQEGSSVPGLESTSHTKVVRKTLTPQAINDPHQEDRELSVVLINSTRE